MPQAFIEFYYDTTTTITKLYDDALKITALEDDCDIYYIKLSSKADITLLYSIDWGQTWNTVVPTVIEGSTNNITKYGTTICNLNIGESVLLRAYEYGTPGNHTYEENTSFYGYNIWSSKKSSVSGHLWSIVTSENYTTPENPEVAETFRSLFGANTNYSSYMSNPSGNKMSDASNLKLPNFVTESMYTQLFYGCRELVSAPVLPATTLASGCYGNMFQGCTSLVNIPELPATTLASGCYSSMFSQCTSLTTAPSILPATTLASGCYGNMFSSCYNLISPPNLPATILTPHCYYGMFYGCRSLTFMPLLPAITLADSCYKQMFMNCSSLISSNSMYATTAATSCCEEMFNGCTALTVPPEIHITTLATDCFKKMFYSCTSLVKAPELFATTLVQGCYTEMFRGCTSLSYIKTHAVTRDNANQYEEPFISLNQYSLQNWVDNVAPTGTFVKDPNVNYTIDSPHGVPIGWTLIDDDFGKVRLNIIVDPVDGGTAWGSGVYDYYSLVQINAMPARGYRFLGWYDSGDTRITRMPQHSFIIYEDTTITCKFTDEYVPPFKIVEVSTPNPEHGDVTGGGEYDYGETVILEALPNTGYHLLGWYDLNVPPYQTPPLLSTSNPYSFNVYNDAKIEGRFEINPYSFSYTIDNPSYGTVTGTPTGTYTYLEPISLAAQANSLQYRFVGWFKGDTLITRNPVYEFGLTEDTALIARFRDITEPSEIYEFNYFTIESLEDDNEIRWWCTSDVNIMALGIFYSFDMLTWRGVVATTANNGTLIATLQAGEKIYFKSTNSGYGNVSEHHHSFRSTHTVNVSGNIMSLLYGDYFNLYDSYSTIYTFKGLFYNDPNGNGLKIVDASNLILPATTLTPHCYYQMFANCQTLTSAPELPFINAAYHSCDMMFRDCISLTTAPELPAIYLDSWCYASMFYGCTSLTNAPELPATSLYQGCYATMFASCVRLTTPPELPATVLAPECYKGMFRTTPITTPPELPAHSLAERCYDGMFENSGLITAPELGATTLEKYCYTNMFANCRYLIKAPDLPAPELVEGCYNYMFYHCSSLNYIKTLNYTDTSEFPTYYTNNWTNGVASSGIFVILQYMEASYFPRGVNGIPQNWTVIQSES